MNGNEECNHLCDLHTTGGHIITVTRTTTKTLIKDTTKQFVVVKTLVVVNHTGFSNLYFHSVSHRKVHGYCHFVVFVTISTLTGSTPCAGALSLYMVSMKFHENCVTDFLSLTEFGFLLIGNAHNFDR